MHTSVAICLETLVLIFKMFGSDLIDRPYGGSVALRCFCQNVLSSLR